MAGRGEVVIRILGDAAGLDGTLGATSGKLGAFGSGAIGVFAGVGAAALAVGGLLLDIGTKFEEAFNTIRRETGATGPQLQTLETNFKDVVSTVPAKFGDAAEAVSKLHQILGLSGGPLEKESEQVLELNRITGGDLSTTLTDVTGLFSNWQVATKDQGVQLDSLFRASQISGTGVQTLMEQVQTSGAVFRGVGFSLNETTGLLALFDKAGLNTDGVVAALKKSLATFAKEGKDPRTALMGIIAELQKAPDSVKATEDAFTVFGARGGQQLIDAVKTGRVDFKAMMDTIAGGSDTIRKAGDDTMTLKDRFEVLKNKVFVELEPIASKFLGTLVKGVEEIGPAFDHAKKFVEGFVNDWTHGTDRVGLGASKIRDVVQGIGTFLGQVFSTIRGFIGQFVDDWNNGTDRSGAAASKIQAIFGQVWATLKSGFEAARAIVTVAVQVIEYLWDHFGSYLLNALKIVWNLILGVIKAALEILKGIWDVFAGIFTGDFGKVWQGIREIFSGAWDWITSLLTAALGLFWNQFNAWLTALGLIWDQVWNGIKAALSGVWDGITGVVSGAFGIVKGIFNTELGLLKGVWQGFWDGLSTVATGVKDAIGTAAGAVLAPIKVAWNTLADAIDSIKIDIDSVEFLGATIFPGLHFHPNIPHLATGGVASNPMLALIGDTPGQSEIVTPENLMRRIVREELDQTGHAKPVAEETHFHFYGVKDGWDAVDKYAWHQRTSGK